MVQDSEWILCPKYLLPWFIRSELHGPRQWGNTVPKISASMIHTIRTTLSKTVREYCAQNICFHDSYDQNYMVQDSEGILCPKYLLPWFIRSELHGPRQWGNTVPKISAFMIHTIRTTWSKTVREYCAQNICFHDSYDQNYMVQDSEWILCPKYLLPWFIRSELHGPRQWGNTVPKISSSAKSTWSQKINFLLIKTYMLSWANTRIRFIHLQPLLQTAIQKNSSDN